MSVELMSRVWKDAPVGGSELLVLLALADFGNDDGTGIYPSIRTIAKKARLSVDQTRRIIHKLIAEGLVDLVEIGGWDGRRNRPNEYKIVVQGAGVDASTVLAPVQGGYSRGRKGGTRADASTVLAPVQADPLIEPLKEPPKETKEGEHARPRAGAEFFDARKFVGGKVPAGTGSTPAEVFYEVHTLRDDRRVLDRVALAAITEAVSDVALWRQVVTAWALAGNKPTNISGQLDWYRDPRRFEAAVSSRSSPATTSKVAASLAAVDEYFALKEQHLGGDK